MTNGLLIVLALVTVGWSVYLLAAANGDEESLAQEYKPVIYTLLGVGCVMFVLGLIGCGGARISYEYRRRLLFPYFIILQLLFGVFIAVGTLTQVLGGDQVVDALMKHMCNATTPTPKFCAYQDDVIHAVETHSDAAKWSMFACAVVMFLTISASFRAASEGKRYDPSGRDVSLM